MEVQFKSNKERDFYQDIKALRKDFGDIMAKLIVRRINELEAFDSIGQLMNMKIGKPHFLTGEYIHCIGLSLTGNYRLIVKPLYEENTDFSKLNLDKIFIVRVMEVIDYHGN